MLDLDGKEVCNTPVISALSKLIPPVVNLGLRVFDCM